MKNKHLVLLIPSTNSLRRTEMTNKEQLHQNFLKDFKELLEKYDAIFQVSDIIDGCVPSIVFPSYYDYENDRLAREYSILEIPNYINSHR